MPLDESDGNPKFKSRSASLEILKERSSRRNNLQVPQPSEMTVQYQDHNNVDRYLVSEPNMAENDPVVDHL